MEPKTYTSDLQDIVEQDFLDCENTVVLRKQDHIRYILGGLSSLPSRFTYLDASQPWLCYWMLHSLEILRHPFEDSSAAVQTIARFQNENGGFGGGHKQIPHLASTYAAVMALVTIGTEEAYNLTNKEKLYSFLMRLKQPNGSFRMHDDGEIDVRGVYCALSVAFIFNITTPELIDNCEHFIKKCQTYEGGIAGIPGSEAHGGYTFCAFAALIIIRKVDILDVRLLHKWAVNRQMRVEKGFQGRTNKLADGCYGFWMAGLFPLLSASQNKIAEFDDDGLYEFLLSFCQGQEGFADRISENNPDFYHTCYCLSGLALMAHNVHVDPISLLGEVVLTENSKDLESEISPTHPVFNVSLQKANKAILFFREKSDDYEEIITDGCNLSE